MYTFLWRNACYLNPHRDVLGKKKEKKKRKKEDRKDIVRKWRVVGRIYGTKCS